ncbi:cell division protein FtsQ/DivIB [Wolbachia endosymbiont of Ctenocephalides felis wCfeT]|uniref:cell division protein FtsQ/DivIB n=1 Tax=Wolbachia endosymbiont of Ctenocephalides felis wCfeT TaxID=2732593 RepID=UPI001447093B|nr:cell division protein FtsQ/DivIB [Wolbachia endosymbiont of Ctenocephalides felis wCfeT]
MLSSVTRSQRRFLRKCAFFIITSLFLTLVILSSLDKIIDRFNYYFNWCDECVSSFLLNSGFKIDEVIVTGNKFVNEQDIVRLVDKSQPIIYVSLSKLASDIQSTNKWAKHVSVHRILPSTLQIDIEEHKPFALWKDNNKTSVIDSKGEVIVDDYLIDNLVTISGQNSLSNLEFVKELLESKAQLSGKISSFICVGNRRWNVVLDDGPTVKLPEDNPLGAWDYLNHLHDTTDFAFSDWSIIDMRIADKIFVKR